MQLTATIKTLNLETEGLSCATLTLESGERAMLNLPQSMAIGLAGLHGKRITISIEPAPE